MLLFGGTLLTAIAPWVNIQFLGSSLTFMMVYVWGRRHQVRSAPLRHPPGKEGAPQRSPAVTAAPARPKRQAALLVKWPLTPAHVAAPARAQYVNLSFLGIFNFTAPYLPWVLLVFSLMLGSSPLVDLLGMAAGAQRA